MSKTSLYSYAPKTHTHTHTHKNSKTHTPKKNKQQKKQQQKNNNKKKHPKHCLVSGTMCSFMRFSFFFQDIFFVCQIPNTLSILNKAEGGCRGLVDESTVRNGDRVPVMKISSGERSLQTARFFYTLNRLLNHPKNKACNGLARLLLYDGLYIQFFCRLFAGPKWTKKQSCCIIPGLTKIQTKLFKKGHNCEAQPSRVTERRIGEGQHYENTPIQIYRKFHLKKLKIIR